jgi:hypothetical protein
MKYLKHFLIGLASLVISLAVVTVLALGLVLLLPLIWAFLTLVWINSVRTGLAFLGEELKEEEEIIEEDNNG